MDLGEFGVAVEEADLATDELDHFAWYDKPIRLRPLVGLLPTMRFMAEAAEVDLYSAEALAAMYTLFQAHVWPEDWATFNDTAGVQIETAIALAKKLIQRETGLPTSPPSESSGGRPTTGADSKPEQPGQPLTDRQQEMERELSQLTPV